MSPLELSAMALRLLGFGAAALAALLVLRAASRGRYRLLRQIGFDADSPLESKNKTINKLF